MQQPCYRNGLHTAGVRKLFKQVPVPRLQRTGRDRLLNSAVSVRPSTMLAALEMGVTWRFPPLHPPAPRAQHSVELQAAAGSTQALTTSRTTSPGTPQKHRAPRRYRPQCRASQREPQTRCPRDSRLSRYSRGLVCHHEALVLSIRPRRTDRQCWTGNQRAQLRCATVTAEPGAQAHRLVRSSRM